MMLDYIPFLKKELAQTYFVLFFERVVTFFQYDYAGISIRIGFVVMD